MQLVVFRVQGTADRATMIASTAPIQMAARLCRALAKLGLLAALAAAPSALAQSALAQSTLAQPVLARGAEHEDFGCLVLDFDQPVASRIAAQGAHMEIQFGRAPRRSISAARCGI